MMRFPIFVQSHLLCLLAFLVGGTNPNSRQATNLLSADWPENAWSTNGIAIAIPTREFSSPISVPPKVVQAAKTILKGDPDTWRARDAHNYMTSNVIWLFDEENHFMSFLPQAGRWVRLNDRQGLPSISQLFHLPENDLKTYADFPIKELSCIYEGYDAIPLTAWYCKCQDKRIISDDELKKEQKELDREPFKAWIPRTGWEFEQNPQKVPKLRSLCGEQMEITDKTFRYTINCLTSHGSIVHWDVRGSFDDHKILIIKRISITELEPKGTFEYPIRGGFW